MYNNKKIGIGIITYNRQQKFVRLYNSIKDNKDIDNIVIIKNKDIDYHKNNPINIKNQKTEYFNIVEDVGVGVCKNKALQYLLDKNCDYIFIIQDDLIIKNNDVFKQYINVSNIFNIGHLNFNGNWDNITKNWLKPFSILKINEKDGISLYNRLCGNFQFFTKQSLLNVGLLDQKNFFNALEHVDHTYRMSLKKYTTPFHVFVDIMNSNEYLQDDGIQSSISKLSNFDQYVSNSLKNFNKKWGCNINQIKLPTQQELINFIKKGLNNKNV